MKKLSILILTIFALCLYSPAFSDEGKDESGKAKDKKEYRYDKDDWEKGKGKGKYKEKYNYSDRGEYIHRHGYTHLNIPPGHYPPPGECRIWHPDRPAGNQPPPTGCDNVPPGAWVITHPRETPGYAHVTVFDPYRPGKVYIEGVFDIGSGSITRVILNK